MTTLAARPQSSERSDLSSWHLITLVMLFVGYAGYYFCRTNLALSKESLVTEFQNVGITKDSVANIGVIALLFYSLGKLLMGTACDFVGGRPMFIGGMIGSVAFTYLFLASTTIATWAGWASPLPLFIIAFSLNRFIQSSGWGALVKVSAAWFGYATYGRVMGFLCSSYLLGDAAARLVIPTLVGKQGDWRDIFFVSANILAVITVLNLVFLRRNPSSVGLPAPAVNPVNLHGQSGEEELATSIWDLLRPYLTSFAFWLVLVMSITLSFIREGLNFFNNDYLRTAMNVDKTQADQYSAFFPIFGALAVFTLGFLTDRLYKGRRGLLMAVSMAAVIPVLWAMAYVPSFEGTFMPLVLTCMLGFLTLAPYAFLTGAIALDLGGKKGSSSAAGMVDALGYALGAIPSLSLQSRLVGADRSISDWRTYFLIMIALSLVTCAACLAYWLVHERKPLPSTTKD